MVNNLFRVCRPNCLCHQYLTPPTQPKTATATTNGRSKSRAGALVTQTGRLGSGTLGWCPPTHPALRSSLTYSAPRAGGGGGLRGHGHAGHGASHSPLTLAKGRPTCYRAMQGHRAELAVSNPTPEQVAALQPSGQPDLTAPPSLQVGAAFLDLESCTSHTHPSSHVKHGCVQRTALVGRLSLPLAGPLVTTCSVPFHPHLLHRLTPKHRSLCHGRPGFSKQSQCGPH